MNNRVLNGDWRCGHCGNNNFARRERCHTCGQPASKARGANYTPGHRTRNLSGATATRVGGRTRDERGEGAHGPSSSSLSSSSSSLSSTSSSSSSSSSANGGVERRYDPTDGRAYTHAEFIEFYGGHAEWNRAAPANGGGPHSSSAGGGGGGGGGGSSSGGARVLSGVGSGGRGGGARGAPSSSSSSSSSGGSSASSSSSSSSLPSSSSSSSSSEGVGGRRQALPSLMNQGSEAAEIILSCPASCVGSMIGSGGCIIKDLQIRSRCVIQIDQDRPAGAARPVIIVSCYLVSQLVS